jgi:DnaK suppressor protein
MNDRDTTQFIALINKRLSELEAENQLGQAAQAVVQLDQQSVGRLSRMDALQNQAMAKAQQTRRDQNASRLQAALRRIEADDFGYCDECGEDIAPKRLELDPSVTKCISCAST